MKNKYLKIFLFSLFVVAVAWSGRIFLVWPRPGGAVLGNFASSTPADLQIDFFSVGQGDSELIISPHGQTMLVDGGPDNTVVQKLGQYLPPGDNEINYVLLTHPHADHVGGLPEVLRRYKVDEIIYNGARHTAAEYKEFLRLAAEQNIPEKIIDRPQEMTLDCLQLDFLAPLSSFAGLEPADMNNSSIVFKLIYGSTSAMFTGDMDLEETLLNETSTPLKSDLLKVGHHGSTNANCLAWLTAVRPENAVIEVGANNTYGLPGYRTIYDLQQLGAKVWRTDQDGDVVFTSDGGKFMPKK